jgi:spore coat polysaccharide biosynthesis protein SpsF
MAARNLPAFARDTGLVVQVRLGSTRLPSKALLPLGGATVTDQVLARLALVPASVHVLATDAASSGALAPIAERHGFELVVGSPDDVLSRFCVAIRRFGMKRLIRATGDNPLVNHELAVVLLEWAADEGGGEGGRFPDYAAFSGLPLGMGVELVSSEALLRAEVEARALPEREHVCPYLYGHPELFTISRPEAPPPWYWPAGRVTVDTREDYEAVLGIYGALYSGSPIPSLEVLGRLRDGAPKPGGRP